MYFIASKIFWFLAKPSNFLLICLTLGLLLRFSRFRVTSGLLILSAVAGIWAMSIFPAGEFLLRSLETRFPIVEAPPDSIGGIIVLGGALSPTMTRATGQFSLNGNAERYIYLSKLSKRYPSAPLLFTGGSGDPLNPDDREGDHVKALAPLLGLDPSRLIIERESRNTYENALYSKKLAATDAAAPWLLVTSARHMPRAVGIFRAQGWPIVPYPVDFQLDPNGRGSIGFRFLGGLATLDSAVYEYIGMAAAYVFGHSGQLFPGPVE